MTAFPGSRSQSSSANRPQPATQPFAAVTLLACLKAPTGVQVFAAVLAPADACSARPDTAGSGGNNAQDDARGFYRTAVRRSFARKSRRRPSDKNHVHRLYSGCAGRIRPYLLCWNLGRNYFDEAGFTGFAPTAHGATPYSYAPISGRPTSLSSYGGTSMPWLIAVFPKLSLTAGILSW